MVTGKNRAREKLMKKKPYMWSTNPKNIFMHWPKNNSCYMQVYTRKCLAKKSCQSHSWCFLCCFEEEPGYSWSCDYL